MIGRHQIVISGQELASKGMSSGQDISDGAFSPETEAVNFLAQPGVIYAPAAEANADIGGELAGVGEIIATSPDHNVFAGDPRLLVSAKGNGDGSFHRYDGTSITAASPYATDTTNNYGKFFTDIINYAGETYVTAKELVKRWTSTGTLADLTGGAFTNTTYPHPAIVAFNNAYYGDGNLLLRQTAANGALATILTLSANEIIIALGIDPGTGKILISTSSSLNVNNTLPAIYRIHWYDGSSSQPSKTIQVEGMITAIHSHSGVIFVGYDGNNVGYLNGSGINFLRKLINASNTDVDQIITKHSFCSMGRTLCVIDGAKVLAYGPIITGGNPIWYYIAANKFSSPNKFLCIFNAGSNKLGLSAATEKFYTTDITSKATIDNLDLYSDWYYFQRPVFIRNMYVQFAEAENTANWAFTYFDGSSAAAINTLARMEGAITPVLEADYYVNFADNADTAGNTGEGHQALRAFKLRGVNGTANKGIKQIIVYYDSAEN